MNSLSQSVQSGSATWRLLMNRGEGVALDTLALTAVSCTRIARVVRFRRTVFESNAKSSTCYATSRLRRFPLMALKCVACRVVSPHSSTNCPAGSIFKGSYRRRLMAFAVGAMYNCLVLRPIGVPTTAAAATSCVLYITV